MKEALGKRFPKPFQARDSWLRLRQTARRPWTSGMDLYETILKRHPRLKGRVIIMTGDVISADTKDFFRNADCHYMLKPFNVKELIKLARKLLSSTAAQG